MRNVINRKELGEEIAKGLFHLEPHSSSDRAVVLRTESGTQVELVVRHAVVSVEKKNGISEWSTTSPPELNVQLELGSWGQLTMIEGRK